MSTTETPGGPPPTSPAPEPEPPAPSPPAEAYPIGTSSVMTEPTLADVMAELRSVRTELDAFKANPIVAAMANVDEQGPDRMSGFSHIEATVRDWIQDELAKSGAPTT